MFPIGYSDMERESTMQSLSVNDVLPDEITPLNHMLLPLGFRGDQRAVRAVQETLKGVIDALGEESARAQRLDKVITSSDKLRDAPGHVLYLLKDAAGAGGRGELLGLLKVGRKHLFLYDERGAVREVEPLCLLDFYVRRERRGHGKRLFDYMLQDQQCTPVTMAVDGPSEKMERFLHKNYGIDQLVRQSNNFAVAPQYFDATLPIRSEQAPPSPMPACAVGRFTARKPESSIGMVIHGAAGAEGQQRANGGGGAASNGKEGPSRSPSPTPELLGAAGSPTPEPPRLLRVLPSPPARSPAHSPARSPAHSPARSPAAGDDVPAAGARVPRRGSEPGDRDHLDVKYHHTKLW